MYQDPYKVLGLSPGASDEEVTKAYRKLAKKDQPGVDPNDKVAANKRSEIKDASQNKPVLRTAIRGLRNSVTYRVAY